MRDMLLRLADELEGMDVREGCRTCPADGTKDCRGDVSCEEAVARAAARRVREAVARAAARRVREIVEHDACDDTTVSAYDLLPDEDRKAIAWVREKGGVNALSMGFQDADNRRIELCSSLGIDLETGWADAMVAMRRRLMPEGMEWLLEVWPKWSNGEYCKFGDWWTADKYGDCEPKQLRRLCFFTPEQLKEWEQDEGDNYGYEWDFMRPSDTNYRPDKAETPASEVLAADGEPLEAGQTVYAPHYDYVRCTVLAIEWVVDGYLVEVENEGGHKFRQTPDEFTHQRPVLDADGNRIELAMDVWWVCEGDERGIHAEKLHVESIGDDGFVECSPFNGGTWVELDSTELYVHKPVLDADGVPIKEGDTVYGTVEGGPFIVTDVSDKGSVFVDAFPDTGMHGSMFTHAKPEPSDSWERIEEDKDLNPFDYCKKVGHKLWTFDNAEEFKASDLVRRCRALTERGA